MKKIICGFIYIIGFATLLNAQISYKVNFEKSKFKYEIISAKDGETYQKVTTDEYSYVEQVGAPNLPVKYVKLIIPAQQDVKEINYIFDVNEKKNISYKIYPTQFDIPTSINTKEPDFVKPDPNIYQQDKPWPEKVVELVHSGYLDHNNHIITLKIIPFRYFPKINRLDELNNIQINIKLKPNDKKIVLPKIRTVKTQKIWDNALEQIVDNKDDIIKYQQKPKLSSNFRSLKKELSKTTNFDFYEYVIITTNALKGYFNNFVNYKHSKGLDIGVVTVSAINNEYQGYGDCISGLYDGAANIRGYLWDAYDFGTTWVLLAGDFSVVPIRYGSGANQTWTVWETNDYKIPADLYFADIDGNWNVDGDKYLGEPTHDNPDYYPEFFVGRLLCTKGHEITDWSDKIVLYEEEITVGNPDYVTKCFMIESDQLQEGNQAEYVKNHLPSFNTTIWREQPSAYAANPTFPTAHQVLVEMNHNYGFYGWFGHGSPTTVTTMSRYYNKYPRWCLDAEDDVEASTAQVIEDNDALDNLTNYDHPAVVYSIACENTPFDNYHTDPYDYNMGESFTVNNSAGGPAFLGNTRYGWIACSYKLFGLFADQIEGGSRHLGVAELISKSNNTCMKHYLSYSHNLVGCPETEIWTSIPNYKKSVGSKNKVTPKEYKIIGNYPNPFNPSTNIKYFLPYSSNIKLTIFNIMGEEVKSFELFNQPAGYSEISWNGTNNIGIPVSSGIYLYTFEAVSLEKIKKEFTGSSKLILLK